MFQAIRIAVNDELRCLEMAVEQGIEALAPCGRFVIISFHSGEDRIVKNMFRNASRKRRELRPDGRVRSITPPRLKILTPKPIVPCAAEIRANPRAKSGKLRAAARV